MSQPPKKRTQSPDLTDQRVLVAMSGGVDSSTTAALLVDEKADVIGVSMQRFVSSEAASATGCGSPEEAADAQAVAEKLGIPFHVMDFSEEFHERIIRYFVDEYKTGRTPSPCVLCNVYFKFGRLLRLADELGASRLATGHYARIECAGDGRYGLFRGVDRHKDQSYFLFGIDRNLLPRILFPLGGFEKRRVRELAQRYALPTAKRAESQDLCFVAGDNYLELLEQHLELSERISGEIVHVETGKVLGQHKGIHRYTIGQRRGLGVGGADGPLYVVGLSAGTGRVVVGPRDAVMSSECIVSSCNWLAIDQLVEPISALVQVRYRHTPVPARVEPLHDDRARIIFETPEAAVAPGQAAVFYWDEEVVGGGWIDSPR